MTADLVQGVWHRLVSACPGLPDSDRRAVVLQPTRAPHWDLRSNVAHVAARASGQAALGLARAIAAHLAACPEIDAVGVAATGALNLRLTDHGLGQVVAAMMRDMPHCPRRASDTAYGGFAAAPDAAGVDVVGDRAFRVHYAYARCRTVLRAAADVCPAWSGIDLADHAAAIARLAPYRAMLVCLALWPYTVSCPRQDENQAGIVNFLYGLADVFDTMWHHESGTAILRFIRLDEPDMTRARLALVAVAAQVIQAGLGGLGVEPIEELR